MGHILESPHRKGQNNIILHSSLYTDPLCDVKNFLLYSQLFLKKFDEFMKNIWIYKKYALYFFFFILFFFFVKHFALAIYYLSLVDKNGIFQRDILQCLLVIFFPLKNSLKSKFLIAGIKTVKKKKKPHFTQEIRIDFLSLFAENIVIWKKSLHQ